MVFTY